MGVEYVESHVAVLVTDPHPAAGDELLLVPVPATVSVSGRLRVLPAPLTTWRRGSDRVWAPPDTQTWRALPRPQTPATHEHVAKLIICHVGSSEDRQVTSPPHPQYQSGTSEASAPRPQPQQPWTVPAWCGPASWCRRSSRSFSLFMRALLTSAGPCWSCGQISWSRPASWGRPDPKKTWWELRSGGELFIHVNATARDLTEADMLRSADTAPNMPNSNRSRT